LADATTTRIVVKIGGSTLGSGDTTLEDVVALQQGGAAVVVVHGGGATISEWLKIHQVESRFVRGLRVTDSDAVQIVVAVLAGVINKDLVTQINGLGGRAVGISGADGGLIAAEARDPELGLVGEITDIEQGLLSTLLMAGYTPVIAPVGIETLAGGGARILNINADTVAGEIARAVSADRLVFLTDVPGVMDRDGAVLTTLSRHSAASLLAEGTVGGGMIPKVEAGLRAAETGADCLIIDGRQPHALLQALRGEAQGTRITVAAH
jgi:acetylglutamate kinase